MKIAFEGTSQQAKFATRFLAYSTHKDLCSELIEVCPAGISAAIADAEGYLGEDRENHRRAPAHLFVRVLRIGPRGSHYVRGQKRRYHPFRHRRGHDQGLPFSCQSLKLCPYSLKG